MMAYVHTLDNKDRMLPDPFEVTGDEHQVKCARNNFRVWSHDDGGVWNASYQVLRIVFLMAGSF